MVDLDTLLQPVLDDSPEPAAFGTVQARAASLRRRRVARALIVAVLIVGTAGGAVAAIATRVHRTRITVVSPPSSPPAGLRVGSPKTISKYGIDMLSAFASIWVTQPDRVARFDTTTGRLLATIPVPGTSDFRNLAAGAGSVWVDDTGTQTVTRIDPARNRVTATISTQTDVFVADGLAFVDGKLWVVRPVPNDTTRGDVVSIDPATNRVAQRAVIPRTFDVIAGGTHALWYVRGTDLLRFDTRTLHVTVVRHDVKAVLGAENLHLWLLTAAGVVETNEQNGTQLGRAIAVTNIVNLTTTVGPGAVWIAGQPDSSHPGSVTPYDLVTHVPLAAPTPIGLPVITMSAFDTAVWIDAGGITRIPYGPGPTPEPTPSHANDDVLIFDDGYDGILAVDPTARVAARRLVTGQRAGDQPFRSLLTQGSLVVGWDDVYATPIHTGRSRFIGKGVVIPSESPGRVWLMPFGSGPATYRLVDLEGHVLLEGKGLKSTNQPVAVPGGLAFAGAKGIELWDVRGDHVAATVGTAGALPGVSSGTTLAWSQHGRSDLRLTSTVSRIERDVKLPPDVTGVDVSVARFSNDGKLLAVQASTKGVANGAYAVLIVDVGGARALRTIAPLQRDATFAWNADGTRIYLTSYGYQQPTTTIRRIDLATGSVADTVLPFGGGIAFQVVAGRDAGVMLQGPATPPADCAPPAVQPSGRGQPCRFHY